jgi:hypothetical protein
MSDEAGVPPRFWDDELEQLSVRVSAVHGEEAMVAAVNQVFVDLGRSRSTPATPAEVRAAVKAALEQLVRPH